VSTVDASERLRRAIDILLESIEGNAALEGAASTHKGKPPHRVGVEDTPLDGDEKSGSCGM